MESADSRRESNITGNAKSSKIARNDSVDSAQALVTHHKNL